MQASLQEKYDHLRSIVSQAGSAIIAFSGGVDSTFLLKVCVDMVGLFQSESCRKPKLWLNVLGRSI